MSRGYYPPDLSKTDPLTTVHAKVPKSVTVTFALMGIKVKRPAAYLYREVMIEAAARYERELQPDKVAVAAALRKKSKN